MRVVFAYLTSAVLHAGTFGILWALQAFAVLDAEIFLRQGNPVTLVHVRPSTQINAQDGVTDVDLPILPPTPTEKMPEIAPQTVAMESQQRPLAMEKVPEQIVAETPPELKTEPLEKPSEEVLPKVEEVPVAKMASRAPMVPELEVPLVDTVMLETPSKIDAPLQETAALPIERRKEMTKVAEAAVMPMEVGAEPMPSESANVDVKRAEIAAVNAGPELKDEAKKPTLTPRVEVSSAAVPFQMAANLGVDVEQPATKLATNLPPAYPQEALQAGMQGRVVLRVVVKSSGSVKSAVVESSSGHTMLDVAAMNAVQQWRFSPARRGGLSVESEIFVPVNFSIRRS